MIAEDESLLLYLNEAIATTRDKDSLFQIVTEKLRLIFPFDMIAVVTLDPGLQHKRIFLRQYFNESSGNGNDLLPRERPQRTPVAGSPVELMLQNPVVQVMDIAKASATYPDSTAFQRMLTNGMHYLTVVPLRTAGTLIGFMALAARRHPELPPADRNLMEKIGSLVASAISNTLAFEEVAQREREKSLQLAVNNVLLSIKEREPLFKAVVQELSQVVPFQYFGIRVQRNGEPLKAFAEFSRSSEMEPFQALDPDRGPNLEERERMHQQVAHLWLQPAIYTNQEFDALARRYPLMRQVREQHNTRALLIAPIWNRPDGAAVLSLADSRPDAFRQEDLDVVLSLVPQIALALENLFAFEQIEALRTQVEQERTYLIDEINTTTNFEEVIGNSPVMQAVLRRVAQVAPTDTTVLITGETGTGKELIARALHHLSPRHERALIKLNCAALPAQLIESELFGHEKGSFTGATDRRMGKFELADGGTIFLDEVGELPLDLQAKLLRVLQEKEFERIGGQRVIHSNARVIAATNRVLEDEVAAGRFRADLYYRLNVFPVRLPALRERPEDIEPLARYFLERFTKQMGRPVRGLRERDLQALRAYPWPGNIRELEHVLEQAVIVSQGPFLEFAGFSATAAQASPTLPDFSSPLRTLKEQERQHILAALQLTGGRVSGPNGAAVLLDINPKTLEARMKKLGIRRTVVAGE